jgi:hypothetical protein
MFPSDKLNISIKEIKAELDEKSEHQRIRIYPFRSFKLRFKEELICSSMTNLSIITYKMAALFLYCKSNIF